MGLEANSAGHLPEIAATAFVHPTAILIGRVCVGHYAFIGPQAVVRADEPGPDGHIAPIVIGEASNVQDCVVMHALGGSGVELGPRSSIAHAAVVHGPCKIGARCFIGFHSVVFHATLGDGVIVMHQALVERAEVSGGLWVPSMNAVRGSGDVARLSQAPEDLVAFSRKVIQSNVSLVRAALGDRQACPGRAEPERIPR